MEYAGALYHVMSRGAQGRAIVRGDADRARFFETLGETCDRTGWIVHAYVLMTNHYPLLLETPEANLVQGMKWFLSTYPLRYNARYRQRGHVFQGAIQGRCPGGGSKRIYRAGQHVHSPESAQGGLGALAGGSGVGVSLEQGAGVDGAGEEAGLVEHPASCGVRGNRRAPSGLAAAIRALSGEPLPAMGERG